MTASQQADLYLENRNSYTRKERKILRKHILEGLNEEQKELNRQQKNDE